MKRDLLSTALCQLTARSLSDNNNNVKKCSIAVLNMHCVIINYLVQLFDDFTKKFRKKEAGPDRAFRSPTPVQLLCNYF